MAENDNDNDNDNVQEITEHHGSSSEDDEDEDEDGDEDVDNHDNPVETLVSGREKRTTAGNRLSTLLEQETGEDEVALLFAEDGEDEGDFEDPDAVEASDDDDDSSTDEEDQAPGGGHDENFEGEDQLQKEERASRQAQKRKVDKTFAKPQAPRKKPKTENSPVPAASNSPAAPRFRKRSERVSWVPAPEDAPTRTSNRTLSVQNKERTIASMKESEGRRIRQIAVLEAAQKRKNKDKSRPMTQAERMAEAAKTERLNSKSLNKWEETEKERLKKQKARLEALQNRKLDGPVIRWYSGRAEWVNGRLKHVGKVPKDKELIVELTSNHKANMGCTKDVSSSIVVNATASITTNRASVPALAMVLGPQSASDTQEQGKPGYSANISTATSSGFLDGIDYYASLSEEAQGRESASDLSTQPMFLPQPPTAVMLPENTPLRIAQSTAPQRPCTIPQTQHRQTIAVTTNNAPQPPQIEYSTRNTLTLLNFDSTAIRDRDVQRRILFDWKQTRFPKPTQALCAITSAPAKYLDPATGLAYADLAAYKSVQRLVKGGSVWSNLLGAWVGVDGKGGEGAAKGVPEGFYGGGGGGVVGGNQVEEVKMEREHGGGI